jgi:quercetin dioxygenase-like cupin family protein
MTVATKTPIQLHALQVTFLLDEDDTSGQSTVFETRVPVGAFVPPPHSHDGFDETIYVLEGTFTVRCDGEARQLHPGDAAFVGRGQVHDFENAGDVDGVFLSVATPGVFTPAYFHEIAEVLDRSPGGPPDPGALMAVMTRHGLTPAAPVPQVPRPI